MAKHRRKRHHTPLREFSGHAGRKQLRVWFLEGAIVLLVGLNAFLLYSALSPSTSLSSQSQLPLPAPPLVRERVQVEVLNGCGETGISQQVRKYLRTRGFDVVHIDNAENFEFPETVVLDRRGQNAVSDAARAVAQALGATHVILQRNDDRMVEITVIIGHDYNQLRLSEE